MSVSRRRFLHHSAAVVGGVGLAGVVANQAAAQKLPQSAVAYQSSPNGDQTCANCGLFVPPDGCKTVEGRISPSAWCKIWVKAT
ncbi:MAG: high-potential iron-sulfur protein [Alphaproteobacteria bacterium]|nr:high-potential iron-sulfur protein [Alphaproteobacteria bacterium]